MAFLLIKGSEKSKYDTLIKGFVSQFSLGNGQFPNTVTISTDVLSNHKLDPKFYENKRNNRYHDKA